MHLTLYSIQSLLALHSCGDFSIYLLIKIVWRNDISLPDTSKAQANLLKTDGVELYEISNYLLIIILTTVFE